MEGLSMQVNNISFMSSKLQATNIKNNNVRNNQGKFDYSLKSDTVSFSGLNTTQKDDESKCYVLLRQAEQNGNPRFSMENIVQLQKEVKKFKTKGSKAEILKALLEIGAGQLPAQQLDFNDIANFLCVMSDTKTVEQQAVIDLLAYEKNNLNSDSQDLDSFVFTPLENTEGLIKELGELKLYSQAKNIPEADDTDFIKKEALHSTFCVLADNRDYAPKYKKAIFDKMCIRTNGQHDTSISETISLMAERCDEKQFKTLLPIINQNNYFDYSDCDQINSIFNWKRQQFINDYIEQRS